MWLPQVNSPFNYTLDMLDKEGVDYKYMQADPEELSPSQGIVAQDKVSEIDIDNLKPIWISNDDKVLDGHHRYVAALSRNIPIKCVKVMLPQKDAIRVLNKIQDIFEYENQEKIVEVVAQDQINAMNEPDSGVSTSEILATLEDDSSDDDKEILHDNKKTKKISGYRKKDVNEKSMVGNFFSLKESDGYKKYDMEFDSLLDTNELGLTYNGNTSPVTALCKKWFPKIDFDKIAKNYDVKPESIMNRAVAEKARKMGYDGIKYGDIMVQGL
jgi:hypothetical protein